MQNGRTRQKNEKNGFSVQQPRIVTQFTAIGSQQRLAGVLKGFGGASPKSGAGQNRIGNRTQAKGLLHNAR
jgi:hypothetical protein